MRRRRRDLAFFRAAGVRRVIGAEGLPPATPMQLGSWARVPAQADQYLARLAASGIPVPPPGRGRADLNLNDGDRARFHAWAEQVKPDPARPWVAFGPGSKMASKRWSEDRFAEVGRRLITERQYRQLRDGLLTAGFASLDNPGRATSGWHLNMPAEEIYRHVSYWAPEIE